MFPASPLQGIKIYVNGEYVGELQLTADGWQTYSLHLPHRYLQDGINAFRFLYRYTALPAQVLPGSKDPRMLAVAFDFIGFRPE
jgi:hypothetical protein